MGSINTIKSIISNPKKFLLENSGVRQTIFKNIFWLVAAEGVGNLLTLLLVIFTARSLGAAEYGKFTFALAFTTLFAVFSDLGIFSITIREFSKDSEQERDFPSIISLKILLGALTFFLIIIGSFFVTSDPIIRKIIWILGAYVICAGFSGIVLAFFQSRQKMEYEALAKIFESLLIFLIGFFIIFHFSSAEHLSYGYLISELFALLFVFTILHFKMFPLKISWKISTWKRFLSMAWPLALAGIFGTIYTSIDSVMMGYWGQIIQTGWYNAADKIVLATMIPVGLISASFFPGLTVAFAKSQAEFQKVWNHFMEIMVFLSVPLMAGGLMLASKIIIFVYGAAFLPAVLVLKILIVVAWLFYIGNPFSQILIVVNQQKKIFWVYLSGALFNVGLNTALIPKYSLYGAAWASLISAVFIFFLLFTFSSRFSSVRFFNANILSVIAGSAISTLIMCLILSSGLIYRLNVIISVCVGILVYSICFFILFRGIRFYNKKYV